MAINLLDDFDLSGRRVVLRADLNVPIHDKIITDISRIERVIPTITEILGKGASVYLISHFGRPKGKFVQSMSLEFLVPVIKSFLPGSKIVFSKNGDFSAKPGELVLLENLRFNSGEEKNDGDFSRWLSELGDLYVNDAFSCSHRAHSSIEGIAGLMPAAAGRLMQKELEALEAALEKPAHPLAAIVGGNKVSTKINVLENLVKKVDHLIIGGAMANTFLLADGVKLGRSLYENNMAEIVDKILNKSQNFGCKIHLPVDATIAKNLEHNGSSRIVDIDNIPVDQMILDIGTQTVQRIEEILISCRTLVWNGPLGAFEYKPFDTGTTAVAQAASKLTSRGQLLTVAGGGDTMSALLNAGASPGFSYISSAGGAFLEWLEGKTLPGVAALLK